MRGDYIDGRYDERREILAWLNRYADERGKVDACDEETIRRIRRLISDGEHSRVGGDRCPDE